MINGTFSAGVARLAGAYSIPELSRLVKEFGSPPEARIFATAAGLSLLKRHAVSVTSLAAPLSGSLDGIRVEECADWDEATIRAREFVRTPKRFAFVVDGDRAETLASDSVATPCDPATIVPAVGAGVRTDGGNGK